MGQLCTDLPGFREKPFASLAPSKEGIAGLESEDEREIPVPHYVNRTLIVALDNPCSLKLSIEETIRVQLSCRSGNFVGGAEREDEQKCAPL